MCFSATASFGASGVIFVIGAASISRVTKPGQLMLASTPILFSLQQLSEGILWLSLSRPDAVPYQQIAMYIFVIFGQMVWPSEVLLSD